MQEKGTEPRYARDSNRAKVCLKKEQSQGMLEKETEPRYARDGTELWYAREREERFEMKHLEYCKLSQDFIHIYFNHIFRTGGELWLRFLEGSRPPPEEQSQQGGNAQVC